MIKGISFEKKNPIINPLVFMFSKPNVKETTKKVITVTIPIIEIKVKFFILDNNCIPIWSSGTKIKIVTNISNMKGLEIIGM